MIPTDTAALRSLRRRPELRLPAGALVAFDPTAVRRRDEGRVKVLFVVSAGRSGSTVLDRLIGQYEHVAAVGEVYAIWEVGLQHDLDCGCGRPFRQCPMWVGALERAFGGLDAIDAPAVDAFWRANDRMFGEHFRSLLTAPGRAAIRSGSDAAPMLDALYAALADETGAELVVDTSKSVFPAWLAMGSDVVDPYVLHLVRDPRAVVYSWTRPAAEISEGLELATKRLLPTTAWWLAVNRAAESFAHDVPDRYLRLRYEDVVADPAAAMAAVVQLCGVHLDESWLAPDEPLPLRPTHAGCGNPVRYATELELRPDERWRTKMPAWRARLVAALAWPLARRYGYGLR